MFEKNDTPFKTMLYGLSALLFVLLQSVPSFHFRFLGEPPQLIFALCVGVAFFESETFSAFFALFAGLLSDLTCGAVVGGNAIFFMFTAFFISVLMKTLIRRLFTAYELTVIVVYAVILFGEYAFTVIFSEPPPFGYAVMSVILPRLLFTALCAYPVYPLCRKIHKFTTRRDAF